tara:strand:- start:495 stop:650 length:156 start_codon:yes stop_codon:yes gene_type:complete
MKKKFYISTIIKNKYKMNYEEIFNWHKKMNPELSHDELDQMTRDALKQINN